MKRKPYVRTKAQIRYNHLHPICEIEGCRKPAMPTPHHIKPQGLGGDDKVSNMFSLCWIHHGEIHGGTTVKDFCMAYRLEENPKWRIRLKELYP